MSFQFIDKNYIDPILKRRTGESRIGETITLLEDAASLHTLEADYVILGICEDIGPRANLGQPGASEAWEAFLKAFLNMQCNKTINLGNFCMGGFFDFTNEFEPTDDIDQLRQQVVKMDEAVAAYAAAIYEADKTPIVIGGGHNNAYPLIRAYATAKNPENFGVINLDPHADFRPAGSQLRHSGNSFSTAMEEKLLSKYGVMGLHKAYNSQQILDDLEHHGCAHYFFDDIVSGISSPGLQFENLVEYLNNCDAVGVELDMDSIKMMPVSAMTPSGISVEDARTYVVQNQQTWGSRAAYYHFPEGAPGKSENGALIVGKSLAYLIYDLMSNTE